jgi:hypothetical protein
VLDEEPRFFPNSALLNGTIATLTSVSPVIAAGTYHFVIAVWRAKKAESGRAKSWEIIADNLEKAGWNCGCISSIDHEARQFWVVAVQRSDAGRFVVHADEKLTAFLEHGVNVQTDGASR